MKKILTLNSKLCNVFKNYLKTAYGYLLKYQGDSFINSAGRLCIQYRYTNVERIYKTGQDIICCQFSRCKVLRYISGCKVIDAALVSVDGYFLWPDVLPFYCLTNGEFSG